MLPDVLLHVLSPMFGSQSPTPRIDRAPTMYAAFCVSRGSPSASRVCAALFAFPAPARAAQQVNRRSSPPKLASSINDLRYWLLGSAKPSFQRHAVWR